MKRQAWVLGVTSVVLGLGFAPSLWADLAPGPHDSAVRDERRRLRLERLREQAAGMPSASPHAPGSAEAAPASSGAPNSKRAEALARKLAELVATRHDRREQHRAALERMFGARLNDPAVAAELKLHAVRTADLARVEFLAQNAREGADRQKLLARVSRLSTKERERHARRMARLSAGAAAASGAASAASPPAAPSAGAP